MLQVAGRASLSEFAEKYKANWRKLIFMSVKVIIVDSGVKLDHNIFINTDIKTYEYSNDSVVEYDFKNIYGHGTAVSGIVSKSRDLVSIECIRIADIEYGISEEKLIKLLMWIYKNKEAVDVINLSLGLNICENYVGLYDVCNKLSKKGVVIVSAFDNTKTITYPAAFDNVIGVIAGQYCNKIDDFEYINDDVVNIAAKGNTQRVAWTDPEYIVLEGNSLACAHVTAQIVKFISDGSRTKIEILQKFKEISIKRHFLKNTFVKNNFNFKIKKAVIFPFNKEMHSLVRYQHMLSFDIIDIYDTKYSGTIGANTTHIMKDKMVKQLKVKSVNDINWDTFDTLILGHMDELSNLINDNALKRLLIDEAIKHEKNVYSFDNINELINGTDYKNIFYPKVGFEELPPLRFGMLYRISKPVVGVFGTSSRQGKFTLQLKIRDILLKKGYNVGQIGTEPSALLYDMDYVFPMGYNSSVYIKEFDVICYLNYIMNELCMKDIDIILVGSQSGTLPYDIGNIVQFNIPQFNFLMGTQPHVVVLCINPFDDLEYIDRTVKFIESSVDCKVIAIVVFPMDLKDDWSGAYGSKQKMSDEKYITLKHKLNDHLNIDVYNLGDEKEIDKLVEKLVDFFSE